jgi:hypothetical protein
MSCCRSAENKNRTLCCEDTFYASKKGHLECLKFLRSRGIRWDYLTTWASAIHGHLDCLKYAHENGCEWHPNTTSYAAVNGNLECLKYAHSQGCEWDIGTSESAARNGHLECLKYAYENGCKWYSDTPYEAAQNGHLECLLYYLDKDGKIDFGILNILYTSQKDKNLVTNVLLRKVLLHPRLKKQINSDAYPEFVKAIEDYQHFKNKFYEFIESESNLPIDVIKYELMKYI